MCLHIFDELVGTLQVGPAHALTKELTCTLLEDEVDVDIRSIDGHRCLITGLDGTWALTQRVDICGGTSSIALLEGCLSSDQIGLAKTAKAHVVHRAGGTTVGDGGRCIVVELPDARHAKVHMTTVLIGGRRTVGRSNATIGNGLRNILKTGKLARALGCLPGFDVLVGCPPGCIVVADVRRRIGVVVEVGSQSGGRTITMEL